MAQNPANLQNGDAIPANRTEEAQAKFDLSIALALSAWPALTLAVQNHWGGPNSSEKRDWFAGAISDLFTSSSGADIDGEYLEEFMLQVMIDEFEVNVEDESAEEVADLIIKLRSETIRGEYARVEQMKAKWDERQKGGNERLGFVQGQNDDDDDSESDDEDAEDDDEMDTTEDISSIVITPSEKPAPEADEDGFTKVVGRRRKIL